jgi:hypothetical protein
MPQAAERNLADWRPCGHEHNDLRLGYQLHSAIHT